MRLDIYKDSSLAATFIYGVAPHYYGPDGQQVEALIAQNDVVHNIWTQETVVAPLPERADWWAARIISAPLNRAGFQLRIADCGLRIGETVTERRRDVPTGDLNPQSAI